MCNNSFNSEFWYRFMLKFQALVMCQDSRNCSALKVSVILVNNKIVLEESIRDFS